MSDQQTQQGQPAQGQSQAAPKLDPRQYAKYGVDQTEVPTEVPSQGGGYIPMLAFGRKCGCKLARLTLSPALQAAASKAGVRISDGELVCMGGRACGLSTGLRLSALLELLR